MEIKNSMTFDILQKFRTAIYFKKILKIRLMFIIRTRNWFKQISVLREKISSDILWHDYLRKRKIKFLYCTSHFVQYENMMTV